MESKILKNLTQTNTKRHDVWSNGYKLVCADDKFNKLLKSYSSKDAVYNFISSMTEEKKYCSDVMQKHFNKELVTTNDDEDSENFILIKWWIMW